MKAKTYVMILSLSVPLGLYGRLYGWEAETHSALTRQAVVASTIDDYLKTRLDLDDGLSTELYWDFPWDITKRILSVKKTRTVLEWLKAGSEIEDADGRFWPIRPRHHFHDPINDAGLDNQTDHDNWEDYVCTKTGFDFKGQSALAWAIDGTAQQDPRNNHEKWGTARTLFYKALKDSDKSKRDEYLATTLLKLGCVLHLVEDMGVPAHTRNDFLFGHYRSWYDKGNPLEQEVGGNSWSGSGAVVFDKLAKYFDADAYAGGYLGDGQAPPEDLWGLAECTNYQFLSLSTVFGCAGTKYQFPHPDEEKMGPPLLEGNKIYFDGSNYGVTHLARNSYTYYVSGGYGVYHPVIDRTNTTDDEQVFIDYANITIPRTIDYVTGLANYFFRGRLGVKISERDVDIIEITITNESDNSEVEQILSDGEFELYWDNQDGVRTKVDDFIVYQPGVEPSEGPAWEPATDELPYEGTTKADFTEPTPLEGDVIVGYTLVYKGAISEDTSQLDDDDLDAIAVGVLPGYEIVVWGRSDHGLIDDVPVGSDFIAISGGGQHCVALKNDGSLVAWGNPDDGRLDVPEGYDFAVIAAGYQFSLALKYDGSIVGWGLNDHLEITNIPPGNDFIAISAGGHHCLALRSDGSMEAWGYNLYYQADAQPGNDFIAVSAGQYHSLALKSDGTVLAWGRNNFLQVTGAPPDSGYKAISAGGYHCIALKDNGDVVGWGLKDYGQGNNRTGYGFVAISAGGFYNLALKPDNTIYDGWGKDNYDQITNIPTGNDFVAISAGEAHGMALKIPTP